MRWRFILWGSGKTGHQNYWRTGSGCLAFYGHNLNYIKTLTGSGFARKVKSFMKEYRFYKLGQGRKQEFLFSEHLDFAPAKEDLIFRNGKTYEVMKRFVVKGDLQIVIREINPRLTLEN